MYNYEVKVPCCGDAALKSFEMKHWANKNLSGKFDTHIRVPEGLRFENGYVLICFNFERHEDKVHFALVYA